MYEVNKEKFNQHADLASELLGTGVVKLVGAPSTTWHTSTGSSFVFVVPPFRIVVHSAVVIFDQIINNENKCSP